MRNRHFVYLPMCLAALKDEFGNNLEKQGVAVSQLSLSLIEPTMPINVTRKEEDVSNGNRRS